MLLIVAVEVDTAILQCMDELVKQNLVARRVVGWNPMVDHQDLVRFTVVRAPNAFDPSSDDCVRSKSGRLDQSEELQGAFVVNRLDDRTGGERADALEQSQTLGVLLFVDNRDDRERSRVVSAQTGG